MQIEGLSGYTDIVASSFNISAAKSNSRDFLDPHSSIMGSFFVIRAVPMKPLFSIA